ncbi:MAG: hypothetical protein WBL68_01475 [Nitrososphaeraceae archaeon]
MNKWIASLLLPKYPMLVIVMGQLRASQFWVLVCYSRRIVANRSICTLMKQYFCQYIRNLFNPLDNKIVTVAAGIIFFDDEKGLQRCLHSIQSYVDLIIAIDGKFYFEDDHDISVDNSRKVVESFPNANYYCYPNLTEIDKRNKYLEIAGIKKIDFLLVIDSDEYAVIDMNEFSSNLTKIKKYKTSALAEGKKQDTPDVYGIKIFEKHFEKPDFIRERYIERIFYKPSKLRYQFIHCNLVDIDRPSRNFTTRKYTSEIDGITLYNDDELRSNHYLQESMRYQRELLKSEINARKKIFA